MNPHIAQAILITLRRGGQFPEEAEGQLLSAGFTKEDLTAEYSKVAKNLPGIWLDFEKILADDPIETDPLIAQGNLAILRLDDLYQEVFATWHNFKNRDRHYSNRKITPSNPVTREDRLEQVEIKSQSLEPDTNLINQAINITLASFRIQATLTHRRDQLKRALPEADSAPNPNSTPAPATKATPALEAPPEKSPPPQSTSTSSPEPDDASLASWKINPEESLELDCLASNKPFAKIAPHRPIQPLKGYDALDSNLHSAPTPEANSAKSSTVKSNTANKKAQEPSHQTPPAEKPINNLNPSSPRSALSASLRETIPIPHSRELASISGSIPNPAPTTPQREPDSIFGAYPITSIPSLEPRYHQRE